MKRILTITVLAAIIFLMAGAAFADEMAPCAYDGMLMKKSAYKVKADYKGETLYFCTVNQKKAFMKNPSRYRKKIKAANLVIILNFMTSKEHMTAMKDMGMKMDHSKMHGNHHISALVYDTEKKKFQKYARVTLKLTGPGGKTITKRLPYMASMMHFGADLNLQKGIYKGVAMIKYNRKDYKAGFTWKN